MPIRRWLWSLTLPWIVAFSLENAAVPREEIRSGGPGKDGIPALLQPSLVGAEEAPFLMDDDLVVGFVWGETAHAYPVRVLNWHEVVNDVVEGAPIAVTWCPLTASAVVFDRRSGGDELSFGVSGLLYRSNVLLYDHATESLWSQLGATAISGERRGTRLTPLPSRITTWADWRARHPATRVLSDQTGHRRDYDRDPYAAYHASAGVMFAPSHHDPRVPDKETMLGVAIDDDAVAYRTRDLAKLAPITDRIGGRDVRLLWDEKSRSTVAVDVATDRSVAGATPVYWFAWSAFHPDTRIWAPPDP